MCGPGIALYECHEVTHMRSRGRRRGRPPRTCWPQTSAPAYHRRSTRVRHLESCDAVENIELSPSKTGHWRCSGPRAAPIIQLTTKAEVSLAILKEGFNRVPNVHLRLGLRPGGPPRTPRSSHSSVPQTCSGSHELHEQKRPTGMNLRIKLGQAPHLQTDAVLLIGR